MGDVILCLWDRVSRPQANMVVWQSSTNHQLDFFQPLLGCPVFRHQSMNWMTGDSLWLDLGLKRSFKDFYMEVAQHSDFIFRQAFLNELLLQAGDLLDLICLIRAANLFLSSSTCLSACSSITSVTEATKF